MEARMKNPATILPDAMTAILALIAASRKGSVPPATLDLVQTRSAPRWPSPRR